MGAEDGLPPIIYVSNIERRAGALVTSCSEAIDGGPCRNIKKAPNFGALQVISGCRLDQSSVLKARYGAVPEHVEESEV